MVEYVNQVIAIFKADLNKKNAEATYESILKTEFTQSDSQSSWIEIKDLINSELEGSWDNKQPNTNKLFNKSRLNVVAYFGKPEFIGKHGDKQELIIQKTQEGLELIVFYEVDKAEFLANLTNNLNQYSELSLYMRLDERDEKFGTFEAGSREVIKISHLSLTFTNV